MYFIKIIDESSSTGHSAHKEYGSWSRYTIHDIQGFELVKEGDYHDLVVGFKPEKDRGYFLLCVLYSSGDSFGHSTGNICFVDLYEDETIAEENAERIVEQNEQYKNARNDLDDKDAYSVMLKNGSGTEFRFHATWNGYFEQIEDVIVHRVHCGAKKSFVRRGR